MPNIDASMKEIRRVLKTNGQLLIYMLPNKCSYTEFISRLRGIDAHPVKFNKTIIRKLMKSHGFDIKELKRSNLLPKNLTGLPGILKKVYGGASSAVVVLDGILSKIPLINIISGVWEIRAVKK